jgi:hypothetical protein
LYTTWAVPFNLVHAQDVEAARLLQLLAYFDNQDVWYEHLNKGTDGGPLWFGRKIAKKPRFTKAMRKLCDYSLGEVQSGSQDTVCMLVFTIGHITH